ncbi:MAG: nucleoside deaminase [Xanthomonadales bacterium]|nr:nucleoside deaminase [Gammaproteobacteria bacterium]MBT8054380.1 nucleoside deaminase [Gammaproteobacteria bacterium]NND56456.1 nucleoside deaminase [Xanthomonadales bacterium]NNK51151.1 nucleoside deaminase [Xanthomonadales bacterium]
MALNTTCSFTLPGWLEPFVAGWDAPLASAEQRMALAVALAAENVKHHTGGPFGAIVIEEHSNRLLGVGVNLVTAVELSMAHAEMVAVSLAQGASGHWNLGAGKEVQLVTSCEPCAMCFGAVPWSGVRSIVWGACREDAEAAGFDEGDKPADWQESLERRGITTRGGVLRREAARVLARYASRSGAIYHPENSRGES